MSKTLVDLGPAHEAVISQLTQTGVFKTKAEILRAGVMKLGESYGLDGPMIIKQITNPKIIAKIQKIKDENKRAMRKPMSEEEVLKKYPHLRNV